MKKQKGVSNGMIMNEISKTSSANFRSRRIYSMLLDHFIMSILVVPPTILVYLLIDCINPPINDYLTTFVFFSSLFIYMNKDFLRGKSPAKRLLGYQIIDYKTEKPASSLQCFIRNSLMIFPLEVIIGYLNPSRRLGDYIANTKLVIADKEKLSSIRKDLKQVKLNISFVYILIVGIIYFSLIQFIFLV